MWNFYQNYSTGCMNNNTRTLPDVHGKSNGRNFLTLQLSWILDTDSTLYTFGMWYLYRTTKTQFKTLYRSKRNVEKNLSTANSMQVGGKDVKVLTCDSCAKSSKRPCQKKSEYSGMFGIMYIIGIYQIFLLACDWLNYVMRHNTPKVVMPPSLNYGVLNPCNQFSAHKSFYLSVKQKVFSVTNQIYL